MTKFEDTMKEMQQNVEELGKYVAEKTKALNDSDVKAKAEDLVKKTQDAIGVSMKKVTEVIDKVTEDEKLDEFLDKIKAKSQEAVEFTKTKVDDLTKTNTVPTLEELAKEISANFDKLKESDVVKNAADFLTDLGGKINEFMDKPEVKEAINKAKTTTISVAEAGVEGLKTLLKADEIPAEKVCEETPAEEACPACETCEAPTEEAAPEEPQE